MKSWKRAFLMSAAAVLSFTLASALVNILLPYLLTGDASAIVENPERLSGPGDVIALTLILLIAFLLLVALGAYWLYRYFGPAYYGPRGAARWAVFGGLLALLIKLPDWLFPDGLWLLQTIILVISPFLAFFAARALFPLRQKTD